MNNETKKEEIDTPINQVNKTNKFTKPWQFVILALGMIALFITSFLVGRVIHSSIGDEPEENHSKNDNDNDLSNESGDMELGNDGLNDATIYENNTFSFTLELAPSWSSYKVVESEGEGDFDAGMVQFYLPTKEDPEFTDDPGYLSGYSNLFTISVYVKKSWDDPKRDKTFDEMYGEEIGRNDLYVFIYSHLNGNPPSDISEQAFIDIEKMVRDIQIDSSQ